jgi:ERCC4-type nuclease
MILDYREKDLIALLPEAPTKALPVGDIWIGVTPEESPAEDGVLIERKTIADFIASILDGRYREQRTRLLDYASQTKTSVLYILEGQMTHTQRLQPDVLKQFLNRMMLRYKIPVIHTQNLEETKHICSLLEKQLLEDPKCFQYKPISYESLVKVEKKANMDDPKVFFCTALQSFPGVSATSANAIWTATGSWKALLDISQEDLANIKVGTRRLGPKLAEKLKRNLI